MVLPRLEMEEEEEEGSSQEVGGLSTSLLLVRYSGVGERGMLVLPLLYPSGMEVKIPRLGVRQQTVFSSLNSELGHMTFLST